MSSVAAQDKIAEILVHGNHTTPDADIVALSGAAVGDPASDEVVAAVAQRLRAADRFTSVEVLRRYASIADPTQILLMIVVNERAGVDALDLTPGPLKRARASGMWMPLVSYADGYGFTYGARFAFINPLGPRTRVAIPLTWGGERRAAAEVERTFARGPLTAVRGSAAAYRRVNPHFDVADERLELRLRAERTLTSWLRAGAGARTARVTFGGITDQHRAIGAELVVDTRTDPSFPRNAVYVAVGREQLRFGAAGAARWTTDLRGYAGVGRPIVIALRAQTATSNRHLPPSEQPLLGGSNTLRGYRAGMQAGDNLAAVSAEIRVPVNSPLSIGRFGFKAFVDTATVWDVGEGLRTRRFNHGIGGGLYFGGGPIVADVALAWPEHGKPRLHAGLGITF